MADDILVFTLEGCEPCRLLKMYLDQKGYEYRTINVPDELSRETFKKIYPNSKGFPHTLVNNREVYDLMMYLESGLN